MRIDSYAANGATGAAQRELETEAGRRGRAKALRAQAEFYKARDPDEAVRLDAEAARLEAVR